MYLRGGGTLEIVHRESSKIMNLIESCDLLKSKEEKLDKLLMEKEEQVCILQESLLREESKSLMCNNALNKKILDLEKQVEDRDLLYESGQRQSEKIQDLERILKEKQGIEERLITKNRVNEDKIKLLQQVNSELKYTNCELENRIQTLEHQGHLCRLRSVS
jgi:myosin heavy subunit